MQAPELINNELVLLGGGHSHVSVIKSLGMKPEPGTRVTVICRDVHTPYSGMLPGFVAGHYAYDESHIDLERLCQFAGARLIVDDVVGLDAAARTVSFASGRPDLSFDLLSVNVGSAPDLDSVPGARTFATPVKPIAGFLQKWKRLYAQTLDSPRKRRIVVVGAGAGGVELILSVQHRLTQELSALGAAELPEFLLVNRSAEILPTHPPRARGYFERVLAKRGIGFWGGREVIKVTEGALHFGDGEQLAFDDLLWVTNARGPRWLAETGLPLDARGFLRVAPDLRVEGQQRIFAAGDIASVAAHPREKAGVFAVRQGPPLTQNLRRALAGEPTAPFKPQSRWLSLISTGDKFAVATWGNLALWGKALWPWKDRIDRAFMDRYGKLNWQDMPPRAPVSPSAAAMRCSGCGAKVPGAALADILADLAQRFPAVLTGHLADAAQLPPRPEGSLQTVDALPAFIADPYRFGKITAQHALSDIFASGGQPQTAQVMLSVPAATGNAQRNDLTQLMSGLLEALAESSVALVGGHSVEGALSLGLVVDGTLGQEANFANSKQGAQAGDTLVLTKPLGAGVILAGSMHLQSHAREVEGALAIMAQSNQQSAFEALTRGANAVTDVTGFGLLGHAREMAAAANLTFVFERTAIPLMDGAQRLADLGIASTLADANAAYAQVSGLSSGLSSAERAIFCDPQTSGGLLISLPAAAAAELVDCLPGAAIVGRVEARDATLVSLV